MIRTGYVLIGYAVLNFIVLMATTVNEPKQRKGDASPDVVRGFSGHWMIFYAVAFAVLYSRIHAPEIYRERKCPQGHKAAPTDRFCSQCGYDFSCE